MKTRGFTIVELLIVIVVIGILAAITIVAFNGVQNRANDTTVQSDLRQFGSIMTQYKALNDRFPEPADFNQTMNIKFSKGAYGLDVQSRNLRYCRNATTDEFVIVANSKSGKYFRYTSSVNKIEEMPANYGWGVCGFVGLSSTNPSPDALFQTTWASWVN